MNFHLWYPNLRLELYLEYNITGDGSMVAPGIIWELEISYVSRVELQYSGQKASEERTSMIICCEDD